eukprot:scaffold1394_cov57-Phaeocystis_antarctica.AAC.1
MCADTAVSRRDSTFCPRLLTPVQPCLVRLGLLFFNPCVQLFSREVRGAPLDDGGPSRGYTMVRLRRNGRPRREPRGHQTRPGAHAAGPCWSRERDLPAEQS